MIYVLDVMMGDEISVQIKSKNLYIYLSVLAKLKDSLTEAWFVVFEGEVSLRLAVLGLATKGD